MRRVFYLLIVLGFAGCKTKEVFVPVESVRTEYRDNFVRDSVFLQDSVIVREKGDTVFLERYKFLYRDKLVRDSVVVSDTVRVPVPVEVERRVAELSDLVWEDFIGGWLLSLSDLNILNSNESNLQ